MVILSSWSILDERHGSNHLPIIISLTLDRLRWSKTHNSSISNSLNTFPFKSRLNNNKANQNLFSHLIDTFISSINTSIHNSDIYQQFINTILNSAKQSIPLKNINSKYYTSSPPWWDSCCTLQLISYSKCIATQVPSTVFVTTEINVPLQQIC